MLEIKRNKNFVEIRFETDLPYDEEKHSTTFYRFTYKAPDIQSAELLYRYLRKRLEERIKNIRKKEFFSGWKQAKAKKHGQSFFDWFFCSFSDRATRG